MTDPLVALPTGPPGRLSRPSFWPHPTSTSSPASTACSGTSHRAASDLFGWEAADLEGRHEDEFVHLDDVASLHDSRDTLAEGAGQAAATFRFLCGDGSYRWTETRSRRVDGDSSGLVLSSLRDVSERHQLTMALKHEASTDPLTGVANRTVLMDRLRQGLRRMERGNGVLAVLYIDLDRFKIVNDSLGHRVGDAILLKMAERLTHHIRPADTLARLGGDEFVIVAENIVDQTTATELAKRIIEAGREPFQVGMEEFVCTLSVGVATTADSQRAAEDLLREADLALYRAKDRGRDRAEVFDEELQTKAVGRLVTERMLRRALDEGGLVVEYQPIIDLGTGGAVGSEALVRLRDPNTQGLLQPSAFLDVAEESGLLIAMDERVLADAIKQASGWRTRLAGTQFVRGGHQRHGPPPGRRRIPEINRESARRPRRGTLQPSARGDRAGPHGGLQFGHHGVAGTDGKPVFRLAWMISGRDTRRWPICASSPSIS
jgi:diguanylate cyclase (GGDEF)-like protein/PAS domain S-box-containing protein